jgi:hypothetical protein
MEINRQNYEIYLLDYIEGQLPENMVSEMLIFLTNNPDIELESNALLESRFIPENVKFDHKETIKKNSQKDISGISIFEQLSVSYYENDISENELDELNSIIEKDNSKKTEHKLIGITGLQADLSIQFPEKRRLKHFSTNLWISRNRVYLSIAAGVVIILSFGMILFQGNGVKYGKAINYQACNFSVRQMQNNSSETIATSAKYAAISELAESNDSSTIREKNDLEFIQNVQMAFIDKPLSNDNTLLLGLIKKNSESNFAKNADYESFQVYFGKKIREKVLKLNKNEKVSFISVVNAFGRFTKIVFDKKIEIQKDSTATGGSLYAIKTDSYDFYTMRNARKKPASK